MEKEQLLEVLEAGHAIENEILYMVIQKATDEELQELGAIESVLMKKFYLGLQQTQEGKHFHQKIRLMS